MYSQMNCLIENEYIRELPPQKKTRMYSQMNCLIENDYIKGTFKKKNTYVFPNELPNWQRLHKGNFPSKKKITYVFPNELPNWKRIHTVNFLGTLVFTNELPNWKRIHKVNFLGTLVFTNELENECIKWTFLELQKGFEKQIEGFRKGLRKGSTRKGIGGNKFN